MTWPEKYIPEPIGAWLRFLPQMDSHEARHGTFTAVVDRPSAIRLQRVKIANIEFDQVTQPEDDRQRILDLPGIKL